MTSSSSNLSVEESDLLFELLGARCQSVATAVVQVFFAKKDTNYQIWKKEYVGVACLVKDMAKRSFFIRIYDLSTCQMLWQQEIYRFFEYTMLQPFFHVFEAEDSYVAFNFADEDEAEEFFTAVHSKTKNVTRKTTSPANVKNPLHTSQSSQQTMPSSPSIVIINNDTNVMKNKPSKKKISRADIGLPTDFKHLQHVGYDAKSGGHLNTTTVDDDVKNDPILRQFLIKVGAQLGMNQNELLENQEQRTIVFDFFKTHRDDIDKSMRKEVQPMSPQTFEKTPPTRPLPKIPVEAINPVTRSSRMALELPKPPESPYHVMTSDTQTQIAASQAPRAPPPPPVPAPFNPPPSEKQSEEGSDDRRNALFDQIQKFKHGQQLKPIIQESPNREQTINVPGPTGDLAFTLAKALSEKFKVVASLSNVDEEEWSD